MRVVHIGPAVLPIGYSFGGAVERRLAELAAAQAARGDDVLVVSLTPEGSPRPPSTTARLAFHDVACRSRRPLRDIELLARARAAIRRFAPDVVHVHNSPLGAAVLAGIPVPKVLTFDYFQYRGTNSPLAKAAYRMALKMFDLLLPVSDYCAREAAAWWSLPQTSFRVLPNGVNTDQFRPDAERRAVARRRYGLDGEPVIGYVGRVCEQKGSDLLVEAYKTVKKSFPQVALLVAGPTGRFGSSASSSLTDQIHEVGGRWLGPVPEDELADVYRSLDLCVMPTRQDEMFGMAAAEALSSGTPVVCSDHGGLPEVVPTTAGVLVDPNDAATLANALGALLVDPERRSRLSAVAAEAAGRFRWSSIADQAERIYRDVQSP